MTPTEEQLRLKAQGYIRNNGIGVPSVSVKVSFVALWQTEEYKDIAPLERVKLCDTVNVEFEKLGVSTNAKVIKTVYDTLLERYESIEIGECRSNLADTFIDQEKELEENTGSRLEKAIKHATRLIQGGLGGHVVMKPNADGEPEEILIMDTDDVATAVNVLRINMNGIGFSSNGYNGPFRSAWTLDGHFVADFIDTGTLRANLVKAGILSDFAGQNTWNMETGEFKLNAGTKIGNSTVATIKDVSASEANAKSDTAEKLRSYSTTKEMNTAISASAESVKISADAYTNEQIEILDSSTKEALKNYSTTIQMNSAIALSASSITEKVSATYETKEDAQTSYTSLSTSISQNVTNLEASINLKVSKNDVINQINISTEEGIKIQGSKVDIEGVVTANYIKNLNLEVGNQILMGADAKIAWSNVTGTDNVASKGDIPSDSHITQITRDTVTTSYVEALNITAKKISSKEGNIGGFTIADSSLYTSTASSLGNPGVHVGTDGISCASANYKVQINSSGQILCNNAASTTAISINSFSSGLATCDLRYNSVKIHLGTGYGELKSDELTIYLSSSYQTTIKYNGLEVKSNSNKTVYGYDSISAGGDLTIQPGTNKAVKINGHAYVGSAGNRIAFFTGTYTTGSTQQSVSKITSTTSATASTCASKINEVIDALKAYNLIG